VPACGPLPAGSPIGDPSPPPPATSAIRLTTRATATTAGTARRLSLRRRSGEGWVPVATVAERWHSLRRRAPMGPS